MGIVTKEIRRIMYKLREIIKRRNIYFFLIISGTLLIFSTTSRVKILDYNIP